MELATGINENTLVTEGPLSYGAAWVKGSRRRRAEGGTEGRGCVGRTGDAYWAQTAHEDW